MKQMIKGFEELFKATIKSGGKLADTSRFALENVDWSGTQETIEPESNALLDAHLEDVCARTGQPGSWAKVLVDALLAESDQLAWRTPSRELDHEPDMALFTGNFTATTVIGKGGLLPCDKIKAGFSLQLADTYYPPHAHFAEESYWIIGGDGDWRVAAKPWFPVKPGDSIYHKSSVRHVMQTNAQHLLSVWMWTSHLDSKVVIVRE